MRRLSSLLALFVFSSCGPAPTPVAHAPTLPPPTTPAAPPPLAFADDPTAAARIAADVAVLASPALGGRGTGDEGGRLAAERVKKRFAELKLVPRGNDHDYLQPFQARVGAKVAPAQVTATLRGDKTSVHDASTADGSSSGTASGAAVFVGHGITAPAASWDDYAGADLSGKIAVVLDGVPTLPSPASAPSVLRDFGSMRYKLRAAREHKAAGVVLVTADETLPEPPHDASTMGIPGVVLRPSQAKELFPILHLPNAGPPRPKTNQAPTPPLPLPLELTLTTTIEPLEATTWNVIGMLPAHEGSPKHEEVVVVGAHYDHLGYGGPASRAPGSHEAHLGADDNASGTALLLELARRFSALPAAPSRNILFMAFGAEEIGAIGSRHWVQHPTVPLDRVVAMINADMVGRLRDNQVVVDGVGTSPAWKPLVETASHGLGLDLVLGREGFGASDHASFTAVRVPVAFFFTGTHEDYHRPSDTADKINTAGEARIATLAARLALAVAEAPERLPFVDAPADPHRGMRGGFKVSLGTIPDYAFPGKGLKLDGVRPDAPAARAGLQRGDIIVKLGTHDVNNIHDYMFALRELEPGREVTIEVERAGKRVTLHVVPAPGR